jgi:hypothetical protein
MKKLRKTEVAERLARALERAEMSPRDVLAHIALWRRTEDAKRVLAREASRHPSPMRVRPDDTKHQHAEMVSFFGDADTRSIARDRALTLLNALDFKPREGRKPTRRPSKYLRDVLDYTAGRRANPSKRPARKIAARSRKAAPKRRAGKTVRRTTRKAAARRTRRPRAR